MTKEAMEELLKEPEPSGPRPAPVFKRFFAPLRGAQSPRDIRAWYTATFCASLACILLYTAFGFVFVRSHALRIGAEMSLLAHYGMTALISADAPHLVGLSHQLASALFFGMTLGTLNALTCMVFTFPAWVWGRFRSLDLVVMAFAALTCIYFTYSTDMPWISISFGVVCPVLFMVTWLHFIRAGSRSQASTRRWGVFCCILVLPLVVLVATRTSFTSIRDFMLTSRITEPLSNVYYDHTLLAADVIKPVSARAQNVIAVSAGEKNIGHAPHGTLWILSKNPCGVVGATFAAGREDLFCRSLKLPADTLAANEGNRILEVLSKTLDGNRYLRKGIGFFFFSGPLVLITALILSWVALALEWVYSRSTVLSLLLVFGYLSVFIPVFHGTYLAVQIRKNPDLIPSFAASGREPERYTAAATYPGALSTEDLMRLVQDPSARVRLNALVEAGSRRDASLIQSIAPRLKDPQLNVRTKACWALGKMTSPEVEGLLAAVVRDDPSWYVRDYAYAALGAIRPETRVVQAR